MSFFRTKQADPVVDCSGDEVLTEQSHQAEVDINNIVKRHGFDLIQQTAALQSAALIYDDVTGNDFQEAMNKVTRAQQTFQLLPSAVRSQFDNNPAVFLDFVANPENQQKLIDMGLANPRLDTPPLEVIIKPSETPPA